MVACDNKDAKAELELFQDDWELKFLSPGKIMKKSDITTDDKKIMIENIRQSKRRCIYENDDILVMQSISHCRRIHPVL